MSSSNYKSLSAQALSKKWKLPEYAKQREDLKARGKTIAYAVKMGYEPMAAAETKREIKQDAGPTIAITCLTSKGEKRKHRRFRMLDPKKIEAFDRKYTQIEDSGAIMHLRMPEKPSKKYAGVTIITEGEFKADAISSALGAKVLSIPGVTCNRKNGKLHPHIAAAIGDDEVLIAFDSDQNDKIKDVRKPLLELADDIDERGIAVGIGDVPNLSNQEKTGWDDYIQAKGVEAAAEIPVHAVNSPKIELWRKTVEPFLRISNSLPEALRNIKPNGLEWFLNEPPPQDPVIAPYLNMGESALIVGQGSIGKNFAIMPFFLAICTGTPFFGYPSAKPRRCMYAMLERGEGMLKRRYHTMSHHLHEHLPKEKQAKALELIERNCIVTSLSGEDITLIEFVNNQWRIAPLVDAIIEMIIEAKIEVLFLDPMARLHGGSENDASVASAFSKALERITMKTGCAIVVIHHTGKDVRDDMYAGRGSSGFNDNMSQTVVMSEVKAKERKLMKFKDQLEPSEQLYDIVLFSHMRCSDGAKAGDMYLLRSGETGMFRVINGDRKSDEELFGEILDKLKPWAQKQEGFTCNAFRDARVQFKKDLSKTDAEDLYNMAVAAELLLPVIVDVKGVPTHKNRNGGLMYQLAELQSPSLPAVSQTTQRVKQKSLKTRKPARKK